MKKILVILLVLFSLHTIAINVKNKPHVITQPDGTKIECFITGDEFGGMIHDAEGYAFKRNKETGWWYYATEKDGKITCSEFVVGTVQPKGLKKGLMEFNEAFYKDVTERRKANKGKFKVEGGILKSVGGTMTINTLVVFIRFDGGTEFVHDRNYYDPFFNSTTSTSLKDYFQEVSYNQFNVNSTFYPLCADNTNLSYEDDYTRDYYIDDDYETNGYADNELTAREHGLLKRAVEAIASQVPTNINLDADSDGNVDHVCFIVRGGTANIDFNDLLWPHQWSLYSQTAYINSKRVLEYTFLNSDLQFSKETICHEFFHVLGAPDLYHYPTNDPDLEPAAYWDIMGNRHDNFPHMGAYMKNEYGGWISTIPEITQEGTYTLNPITSSSNNCYKIKSPYNCNEYFIVEYRKQSGDYEGTIEGNGLLVYRINPSGDNAFGPDDEVYIYRPNGTLTVNGQAYDAQYSSQSGRTAINDNTNPDCFLSSGNEGGLRISNIGSSGTTISFQVELLPTTSGPSVVCYGGSTFSTSAPIIGSVGWETSSNLVIASGGTTTTPTIRAKYSTSQGVGWIQAKYINGTCISYGPKKNVWVGTPILNITEIEITSADGGDWYACTDQTGNEFDASYFNSYCQCTNYEIKITNLNGTYIYDQFYASSGTGDLDYSNLSEGWYLFYIRGYNDCGWGDWVEMEMEFVDCSLMGMAIIPNPASDETIISLIQLNNSSVPLKSAPIKPSFDETTEWNLEIYDNMQKLKLKKDKIKSMSTIININNWKEGVYMIRAKYKDDILTGKLIVKK